MKLVYEYSCKWKFFYNPDKSAVMVTPKKEVKQPRTKNIEMSPLVIIKLKRVLNDREGVNNCLFGNLTPRTKDCICLGCKAFNSISSIRIKTKGVCMFVCATIYWSIITSIVTYGSELWVLQPDKVELLRKFHRYIYAGNDKDSLPEPLSTVLPIH